MKWSKLKTIVESFLANNLKGRVQFHLTKYGPRDSYSMARGWITFDGVEIANFSTVEWLIQQGEMALQISEINRTQDFKNPAQAEGYYSSRVQAQEILAKKGVFSRDQFYDALEEYVQLPIETALLSTNPIIQAVSLLDRRCGIRRLESMELSEQAIALVRTCYKIRCEVEELNQDVIKEIK
jgi:hypothetical protein